MKSVEGSLRINVSKLHTSVVRTRTYKWKQHNFRTCRTQAPAMGSDHQQAMMIVCLLVVVQYYVLAHQKKQFRPEIMGPQRHCFYGQPLTTT